MALPTTGYAIATASNPSSGLTDFPLFVDLSDLPAAWWSACDSDDSTRLRFAKSDGTELAFNVLNFNRGASTGVAYAKWSGSLASSGTQRLRVYPALAANSAYAAGDTYGANNVFPSQFVGVYPTRDGSGSTMTDISGNSRDGTLQTGAGWSGDALSFSSSNQGVDLMSDKPLDGEDAFTVILTANATDITTDRGLFYTERHGDIYPLLLWFDNDSTDKVAAFVESTTAGSTGSVYSGASVSASTPYRVALVWDGSNLRLYIDGSEDTAGDFPVSLSGGVLAASSHDNYTLGNESFHSKDFYGTISDVAVCDAALSAAWIAHEFDQIDDNTTFWGTWTWATRSGAIQKIIQNRRTP